MDFLIVSPIAEGLQLTMDVPVELKIPSAF
jgi:hypothetical protein